MNMPSYDKFNPGKKLLGPKACLHHTSSLGHLFNGYLWAPLKSAAAILLPPGVHEQTGLTVNCLLSTIYEMIT